MLIELDAIKIQHLNKTVYIKAWKKSLKYKPDWSAVFGNPFCCSLPKRHNSTKDNSYNNLHLIFYTNKN